MSGRKSVIVTGVSRQRGIGFATAKRLAAAGYNLCIHSFAPYDQAMFPEADVDNPEDLAVALRAQGVKVVHFAADFNEAEMPQALMDFANHHLGTVRGLVLNHTYDALTKFDDLTPELIDRHLAVNVRAALLLIQAFSRQYNGQPGGRLVMLTSGQHLGPMPDLAYVATKGAIHQLTHSVSDLLINQNITVNTVNPGPTRTYTPDPEIDQAVLSNMPLGRWGQPDDAARLIGWLLSDEAEWITGQIINSEGGFRRG